MVHYFLWRNESKSKKSLYDCDICTLETNHWNETRVCYHRLFGKDTYPFTLPVFDEDTKRPESSEVRDFTEEDLFEWVDDINLRYLPEVPAFEIINKYVNKGADHSRQVCFQAFIDFDLGEMIDLENACKNYASLPYDGGVLDQPIYLLEAFNVIREARNRYEQIRFEKMQAEVKTPPQSLNKKR